jgi:predicted ArsR family transcriptional regulator
LAAHFDHKFFESSRGRIVLLLRPAGRTVEELARELGMTSNGVRAHLATLERDGLVRQRGVTKRESGGGKPAYVYQLTPEAEGMFPKAYEPVLDQLLGVLAERVGAEGSEALLREAGARMAGELAVRSDGVRERLEAAVSVLNELGGLAEIEEREGSYLLRSYGCPLASVVLDHPEACSLVEAMVAGLVGGASVREHCDRGGAPRCRFEVVPAGEAARR